MSEKILVVDDEPRVVRLVSEVLKAVGYQVIAASSGEPAIEKVALEQPELVLLDIRLPHGLDGYQVCRRIREFSDVAVIMLTAKAQEKDVLRGFDAGADDYLTKPFSTGEMMARMRVALRRAAQVGPVPVVEVGELKVDLGRRQVTVAGSEVVLTPTEYDLLRVLVQHAGRVLTHHQLLRQVWGMGYEGETHLLRVNVSNLRRKIEPDPARPHYILTEPGVGYRLRADV